LYEIIRDKLLSLDSRLEEVPTKSMISYKIGNKSAFVLTIQKSKIILELYRVKPDDLIDPNNRLRYVKGSMKYRNKHVTNYDIYDISDIES
jgi:predicted transport protein